MPLNPNGLSSCLDVFVASFVAYVLDKTLDVLLLVAGAYHQHIVGVNNDVVLQAADYGNLVLWCEYQ